MQQRIANLNIELTELIYDYIANIIGYAQGIAALFMVILVGYKVMTYFVNPGGNFDPYILVRPILILVVLSLYNPLIEYLVIVPVDLIADITEAGALSVVGTNNLSEAMEATVETVAMPSTGDTAIGMYEILQLHPVLELVHLVISFIAKIAIVFMLLWQLLYKGIYLILGVFVLPLSLIPSNGDVVKRWFFGFVSVLLWIPVLTILQTIIILLTQIAESEGLFRANSLLLIAMQFIMLMMIFRTPRYANYLVSAGADTSGGTGFNSDVVVGPAAASYRRMRGK